MRRINDSCTVCAIFSCTIRKQHCFLKLMFFLWYFLCFLSGSFHVSGLITFCSESEGNVKSGQGFNQGTENSWWVPDDAVEAWQSASLAKWSRRSNSCSPQTGVKLIKTEMFEKSGCFGSGHTFLRSWFWPFGWHTSPRPWMLMAL